MQIINSGHILGLGSSHLTFLILSKELVITWNDLEQKCLLIFKETNYSKMKNQNYVNYMASDGSHQQEPFKKKWFIRYLNLAGIFPSGSGGFLGHKDAIRLQRRIYQRICFQLLHFPDSFHQIRCPFEVFWQYERLLIGIQ